MAKAFKNNLKPGVPKMTPFKEKAPGVVAAMPKYGAMPPMKPHTVQGMINKTKFTK